MRAEPAPGSLTGKTLSHYRVLEKLGAGGMGEVYLAEDDRLGRRVALKVLPTGMASDPAHLLRFQREAKALAALDHPNIVAVHSVEEVEGVHFLTMDLVEGQSLDHAIPKGGLPLGRLLELVVPMADALAAAHERGIVHRDLKPANVMLSRNGRVRVLDFGLASFSSVGDDEATLDKLTAEGRVVGTLPYMSPEQLGGLPADARSDIFSLGIVLYEMATGLRPFKGASPAEVGSSILRDEPTPVAVLRADLPAGLDRILRRCLQKDPRRRWQSALDVRHELEDLASGPEPLASQAAPTKSRRAIAWTAALLAAAAALALAVFAGWRPGSDSAPTFDHLRRLVSTDAHEFGAALSPDGTWIAYLSNARGPTDVWVKFVSGGDPVNLTAGASAFEVQSQDYIGGLEISPDGTLIAMQAAPPGTKGPSRFSTWVIPAPLGGVARRLLRTGDNGLRWSPDGKRIAYMRAGGSAGDGLLVADADGQNERELIRAQGGLHVHWLRWAPDARFVYFNRGFRNFNTEPTQIYRISVAGGAPEPMVRTARRAVYAFPTPDGRGLLFAANPDSVELSLWWRDLTSGRDKRLTSGVGEYTEPSLSADGRRLIGTVLDVRQNLERVPVAFDRRVAPESLTDGHAGDLDPALSPDGRHLAFTSTRTGARNVWIARADLSEATPLTSGEAIDEQPAYSPDGRQVAFVSDRGGRRGLWVVSAEGGALRFLAAVDVLDTITWSPDGHRLVCAVPGDLPGLVTVSVADGQVERLPTPSGATAPAFSPRGDMLAHLEVRRLTADERDRNQAGTVVRFADLQGQTLFADRPDGLPGFGNGLLAWSPDGRRLAVVGLQGQSAGYIWIVEPGNPTTFRALTNLPAGDHLRGMTWSPDGTSLIVGHIQWRGDIFVADKAR